MLSLVLSFSPHSPPTAPPNTDSPLPPPSTERVRRALIARLLAPAADIPLSAAFLPFVPRIGALGHGLGTLCSINRAVHAPTYNRLIAEAAAARGVVG